MSPPTRRRRSEQGASLLLVMLVLFVLLVVIYQVFFTSQVELDRAAHAVTATRMRYLAEACDIQARSVLLMDLEDATTSDEGGDTGGDAAAGLGGLGGGGGGDGGGSSADVVASTDSLLDEWKNPAALAPALGEGLTLHVEVIDEDSKLNLLALWTEDEEQRKEWRDIFERLLDKAFEGTSLDISSFDTADILDGLDGWVTGDRRDVFDRRDPPKLKRTDAQDEEASEVDTDVIETEEVNFPMTLGELLMIEGIRAEHLHGFIEDDVFYPGLDEYLTVWSHLELKKPPPEEDEFAGSPLAAASASAASGGDGGDEAGGDSTLETATTTNNGQVNCNTAPLMVLRALAPDDIPTAFLEQVVEFRDKIRTLQGELDSLAGDDTWGNGSQEEEAQDDGELDEDDPAYYVFQEPSEVFSKIEDQWDLSVFTDESEKDKFTSRLGVTSEVFTIKIMILDPRSGRRGSYRTVVWRVDDEERPRIVQLVPLEEYYDPRRTEDLPEELADVSEARFDRR